MVRQEVEKRPNAAGKQVRQMEAAVAGGFDCAAIGDARDDEQARWHLSRFSDILKCLE